MKIKVKKTREIEEEINIEIPYYYEYDASNDYDGCYVFGVVLEDQNVSVLHRSYGNHSNEWEFRIYEGKPQNTISNLWKNEYKSNQKKFLKALMNLAEKVQKYNT